MRIVLVGVSGFPYGFAAIKRQQLLGRSLLIGGNDVTVLCSKSTHSKSSSVKKYGRFKGIKYFYAFNPHRNSNFLLRNLKKILSPFSEYIILKKINQLRRIDLVIVSNSNSFLWVVYYFFLSRVLGFKLVVNLVEIYSNRESTPLKKRLNNLLFNSIGYKLYDAYLPISNFIIEKFNLDKSKYCKVPIIVDYDAINLIDTNVKSNYFVYCGSAAYYNSISFILRAFKEVNVDYELMLVVNGDGKQLKNINKTIDELSLSNRVKIMSSLKDETLYKIYKEATALLLPLFDNIQDNARFPHKLAEYLSSGTVVVTNPIGELNNYLKNGENVIFSKPSNYNDFADKLNWVTINRAKATKIGNNGRLVALECFSYIKIARSLNNFMNQITND